MEKVQTNQPSTSVIQKDVEKVFLLRHFAAKRLTVENKR